MSVETTKLFTLVFLKRDGAVLLGLKTRGLGKGLWNGFGGKIEPGETVNRCARRELVEECNLTAKNLKHLGVVRYEVDRQNITHIVHIFTCSKFDGVEQPSEEMNPIKWYPCGDIPFAQMWPDAPIWYPLMLQDKYFSAHVIYSNKTIRDSIIQQHITLTGALELAK